MDKRSYMKKVAVLGAGVMGTQIASHFANAGLTVLLFDLKSQDKDPNSIVKKAVLGLQKLKPNPLVLKDKINNIEVANYDDDVAKLSACDLIIEAIAENLQWKEDLYRKISPHLKDGAILASNTSGISINVLVNAVPQEHRSKFCGIHFFNPPRYMKLVELIASSHTDQSILKTLENVLVNNLGKFVIHAKDTPNFVANRLGVFTMVVAYLHAQRLNIPFEVVDALTGKKLGRAKSATFRTADVVGLDVFASVLSTMAKHCDDSWKNCYELPEWIAHLIADKKLGQKTKCGIYFKDNSGIKIFDTTSKEYRVADKKMDDEVAQILAITNWADKFKAMWQSSNPQAKFLWAIFRDSFHYAATLLGEISNSPCDMDFALRLGFGWKEGLFEIWQQAGWQEVAQKIEADIKSGEALGSSQLPAWVFELKNGIYHDNKHFDITAGNMIARARVVNNTDSIYSKQLFPNVLYFEKCSTPQITLYENDSVVLWHTGDNVGILTFKTKMCAIGKSVLQGLSEALDYAQMNCTAMVIWQEKDIFSVGANLEEFGFDIMMNGVEAVENIITMGHQIITNKLRYSMIPVVAAVRGYTFGGGCEIMLHCSAVVASVESYIGLVEAGVGLLPGWGGTKEMALRASRSLVPWKDFERRYKNLALAQVATSGFEAKAMGFLKESDDVVMNDNNVLFVAKEKAKYLAANDYRPPIKPTNISVFGEDGIAKVKSLLVNMLEGHQISEHDYLIAENIAIVMCGGEVTKGTTVSEDWLLHLEKEKFKQLALTSKTEERIQYMLVNGKPLRN